MITVKQIRAFYPNLEVNDLGGGCNIRFAKGTVLTVWFKRKKWHTNKMKNNDWRRFADRSDLCKIIDNLGERDLKPVEDAPVPRQQPDNVVEIEDKGTRACIDHLARKAEVIAKNNPEDHKLISFCKSLANEFNQYL